MTTPKWRNAGGRDSEIFRRQGTKANRSFPHRHTSRNKNCSGELGQALLPLVIVAVSVVIAASAMWGYTHQPLVPLQFHQILLLDRSDPLTLTQQEELRSIMQSIEWNAPDMGRVSVFYLDNTSGAFLEPEASEVVPNRHQGNLISNERIAEKRFAREFLPRITGAVLGVQNATNVQGSSIVETFVKICKRPDFSGAVGDRRILIFSDMLQNSGLCSEYVSQKNRQCTPDMLGTIMPDLHGVQVNILYLHRTAYNSLQTREHEAMWVSLFQNAGAKVSVDQVY